jgi:hypothetical protein
MPNMTANVRFFVMDWKEHIKGSDLAKAIKEIEKLGHGSVVIDDACNTGSDTIVTLVIPADVQFTKQGEDFDTALGYCSEIHITKSGNLWFKFPKDSGMPATDWMPLKNAVVWVEGIMASDELSRNACDKNEKPEWEKLKAKALALLKK